MRTAAKRQNGVGMIEVLVALLVLAIGVLGYAGLQLNALKSTETATIRSQGTALARDALERMLVNPREREFYLDSDSWDTTRGGLGEEPPADPDCGQSSCDSEEMATLDTRQLQWQAHNILPAGKIRVEPCESGSTLTSCVVVAWGDQGIGDCVNDGQINTDEEAECAVMEVTR